MGLLLGLFLLTFAVSAKMETVQGAVYSSPDTAVRFAQCLIQKMSESPFFTIEDTNSITEVANVMVGAIYKTDIPIRILMVAFVTSMADVILHEDPTKNTHRKGVYALSLEQCSISTTRYVDTEFIMEALGIVASMELSKIVTGGEATEAKNYNPNANIQRPNGFNPSAGQPSPVQIQRMLESFNPNDRTSFEQPKGFFNSFPPALNSGLNPQFNPQATSGFPSVSFPGSVLQPSNFPVFSPGINPGSMGQATANTRFSVGSNAGRNQQNAPNTGFSLGSNRESMSQAAAKIDFPSETNVRGPQQQGNDKVIIPFSGLSQIKYVGEPSQIASSSGGLNIPQNKESSVAVILPSGNKQVAQTEHFQDNPPLKSGEMEFQSPSFDNSPKPLEAIPPSVLLPQNGQRSIDVPYNPSLEGTMQDILINSAIFRNTFNFDIPQENAVNLARSIMEQSLNDYNSDLVNKAVVAVSDEVAKVSYQSPENYALALSNALVNVLKLHNFPLFVDGSRIANKFLSNLDNARKVFSQPAEQPDSGGSLNPEEKPVAIDFQSPPFAPEDVDGERFSEVLCKYLSQSNEFTYFFCNSNIPEDRVNICFAVIKSSLSEFGPLVSSMAASVTSGALAEQPVEWLCSNFAQMISDGISDILEENAVIEGANAQDISDKMIFNLNQQIQKVESPDIESVENFPSEYSTIESIDIMPTLQSSSQSNMSLTSDDSNFNEPTESVTSVSDEMIYKTSDYLPDQTFDADSPPIASTSPPSPIQISPIDKQNPANGEHAFPFTTPFTTEITDELTEAITLTEVTTDFFELSTTENSDTVWLPESDETEDQKTLSSHLLKSFESALEALFGESGSSSNSSDISLDALSAVDDSKIDGLPIKVEEIAPQINRRNNSRKRQRMERRRRKKTTVSDVVTPSIIESETINTDYRQPSRSEVITDEVESPDFQSDDSSAQQKAVYEVDSEAVYESSSYSEDSIAKVDFVELQPSFQGPLSVETATSETMTPKFDINMHDTKSEDLTIIVAEYVSQKASEMIAFIRSGYFNPQELCVLLNQLAPVVNIPPLDDCTQIAAIDYLLNVLKSTIKITVDV